jgi:hypothetical protein
MERVNFDPIVEIDEVQLTSCDTINGRSSSRSLLLHCRDSLSSSMAPSSRSLIISLSSAVMAHNWAPHHRDLLSGAPRPSFCVESMSAPAMLVRPPVVVVHTHFRCAFLRRAFGARERPRPCVPTQPAREMPWRVGWRQAVTLPSLDWWSTCVHNTEHSSVFVSFSTLWIGFPV